MYKVNTVGMLEKLNPNPTPTYTVGVFIYNNNEDANEIEGRYPLFYKNVDALGKDLSSLRKDIHGWLKEGKTVVIRRVDMVDNG